MGYYNAEVFTDHIYEYAKRKGKKIGEVEKDAQVSPGYISRLRKDPEIIPSFGTVISIAAALGVSIDALVEEPKEETAEDIDWLKDNKGTRLEYQSKPMEITLKKEVEENGASSNSESDK